MQKCGGQILFTSKSVGKTWRFKTPAKMCCTFLGKSAGEAGRVFHALETRAPAEYGPHLMRNLSEKIQ